MDGRAAGLHRHAGGAQSRRPRRRRDAGDIVFVWSDRCDVAGAAAFGFVPVRVNRTGARDQYPGTDPAATLPDLSGLARMLAG